MNYVIMCVVFARSIAMEKNALITIKNNDTNAFAINDINGIISTGNTTFFTK